MHAEMKKNPSRDTCDSSSAAPELTVAVAAAKKRIAWLLTTPTCLIGRMASMWSRRRRAGRAGVAMRAECSLLIKKRLKTDKVEEPFSQPSANAHETPGCRSPRRCPGHPRSVRDGGLGAGKAGQSVTLTGQRRIGVPGLG